MSEELIRLSDLTMTFEDGETILDHINLYIRNFSHCWVPVDAEKPQLYELLAVF